MKINDLHKTSHCKDDNAHRIIESFYLHFLERKPDPSGLDTYTKLFMQRGIEEATLLMIHALANSPEYNRKLSNISRLFEALKIGDQLINSLPVNHIISLGSHCLASSLIKMAGLKKFSTPFDWTYSNPKSVIHCIKDRFNTFLDSKYYVQTTSECKSHERAAHHLWYQENFGINHTFNHHNPIIGIDYDYFRRCVDRFNRVMDNRDTKLFIMISRPSIRLENDFDCIVDTLESRTLNSASIQISLDLGKAGDNTSQMHLVKTCGNHRFYKFFASTTEDGTSFGSVLDTLQILQLIKQFKFEIKTSASNDNF
jgi:hypothetical protein